MIIDNTLPEHSDIPPSLEGEVLLERTYTSSVRLSGFLTCSVDKFSEMKSADANTRLVHGWDKYSPALDSADIQSLKSSRDLVLSRKSKLNQGVASANHRSAT